VAGGRERIFLYGTLRRGGSRDATRFYAGAEFVAQARVRGVLHDFGEYPGLRLDAEAGWVRGEIFEVTAEALAGLDEWEGIDPAAPDAGEYRRVSASVRREDDGDETCWVYEIAEARCASRPVIASGDWIAHVTGPR
jgi:gamma-glutamylcyclotransferase (GGCT)/AIG2-like uncharacterized protein YtfP